MEGIEGKITYAVISFPGAESRSPLEMAPWGEKEDVECEDPANAAPMNFGPEPEVIPPAADTFVANRVYIRPGNGISPWVTVYSSDRS